MNINIYIETERLLLRELRLSDLNDWFEMDSDPEVHKYIGNQPVKNIEHIEKAFQSIKQQYIDNGIGRLAVIDKKSNEFIGWSGLKYMTELTNNNINYYDLGYRLKKKYWGQGIATETAFAFLEYAFERLNTLEVFAMANIDNVGSNKVLIKAGLKLIENFDFEGIVHNWYKIKKTEFVNRNLAISR